MEYGYVRVSGKSQNEERQLYAMEKAGIARERLYIDKQSGKDFNRPEYQRLLRKLPGGRRALCPEHRQAGAEL